LLRSLFEKLRFIHAVLLVIFGGLAFVCLHVYRDVFHQLIDKHLFSRVTDTQGVIAAAVIFTSILVYQLYEYLTEEPRRNLYTCPLPYTAFTLVFFLMLILFDWLGIIKPDSVID